MGKDVGRTPFVRFPRSFGGFAAKTWPYSVVSELYTAQMSALMVVCGPHLPLAFQFVCGPGGGGEKSWGEMRLHVGGPLRDFFLRLAATKTACCRPAVNHLDPFKSHETKIGPSREESR